jgi:choline dehydrogenase
VLNTTNPWDAPIINPNFLSTEEDIHILLYALKQALKAAASKAFKGYFKGWYSPALANAKTDEDLVNYLRDHANT